MAQEETSSRHQCKSDDLTNERQVPKQASAPKKKKSPSFSLQQSHFREVEHSPPSEGTECSTKRSPLFVSVPTCRRSSPSRQNFAGCASRSNEELLHQKKKLHLLERPLRYRPPGPLHSEPPSCFLLYTLASFAICSRLLFRCVLPFVSFSCFSILFF